MSKVLEDPTEEDFKRARELAEELRQKLPKDSFTLKVRSTFSGEQRFIRFKPDPKIVGRFRGTFFTVPKTLAASKVKASKDS
jgi:hypothetical protein